MYEKLREPIRILLYSTLAFEIFTFILIPDLRQELISSIAIIMLFIAIS